MTVWQRLAHERIPGTLTWDRRILRSLPGDDVLDLGCGPAPTFDGLAHFAGRRYAVDVNPAAVRAAQAAAPDCTVLLSDGTTIPLPDATVDLVLCKAVLTTVVDDRSCTALLCEAARVLRPGGHLLIADFLVNRDDPYFLDRYQRGAAAGLPWGAFDVLDDDGTPLYQARHFEPEQLLRTIADQTPLATVGYEERPVTTRSGRATRGFVLLATVRH